MTSARLFNESEKLAQAVEFAKQLKVSWTGETQQALTANAECDALLISFHTHVA